MICIRAEKGKNYGAILIPEGIIEFIPEFKNLIQELNSALVNDLTDQEDKLSYAYKKLSLQAVTCLKALPQSIQNQLLLDRDPHGNIQVSKIETERLFIELVELELNKRKSEGRYKGGFNAQPLFCGYEGRSGLPSNFDCQYCYALGFTSALLLASKATGYMVCIRKLAESSEDWSIAGIPIFNMLHLEQRGGKLKSVIRKALVELKEKAFLEFDSKRASWLLEDDYYCPGPIQFEGPKIITDSCPLSLQMREIV